MIGYGDNVFKTLGILRFTSAIIQEAYFWKQTKKKCNLECIHCLAFILHAKSNHARASLLLNDVNGIYVKYEYD